MRHFAYRNSTEEQILAFADAVIGLIGSTGEINVHTTEHSTKDVLAMALGVKRLGDQSDPSDQSDSPSEISNPKSEILSSFVPKFTPGPWHLYSYLEDAHSIIATGDGIADHCLAKVTIWPEGDSPFDGQEWHSAKTALGNAQAIAAFPDFFEIVRQALIKGCLTPELKEAAWAAMEKAGYSE